MAKRRAKSIKIGRDAESHEFRVPVELVTETTAVLGRRGSGKTHTAVVCAEGLLRQGHQVIILDPLDVWWGLKSSKDGASSGFDILLLGDSRKPHTDLPLDEGDAEMVADFLVDEQLPCILSMRHLSKSARKRFAARFAERIYSRKGDPGHNTPCLFIVDEAGTFIPQRVMGEDAAMVGAFESWVRQGRSSGIGVMLIDQRPATVNKEVLTQVELMIAHQLTAPHDKKAVREWVDEHADDGDAARQFFDSLPKLAKGHAWFWSPSWLQCFARVSVDDRTTFDSSATPKAGRAVATPKAMADIDLDALKGKLSKSIEKKKATDPKELQKRIDDLERFKTLTHQTLDRFDVPAFEDEKCRIGERLKWLYDNARPEVQVEVPAVSERDIRRIEQVGDRLHESIDDVMTLVHRVDAALAANLQTMKERIGASAEHVRGDHRDRTSGIGRDAATAPPAIPRRSTARDDAIGANSHDADRTNGVDERLDGPSQRILNALAWWSAIAIDQPTMAQLGFVAGYKPKGGSFNTYVSRLSTAGLVQRGGGRISLTGDGSKVAKIPLAPPGIDDLHSRIIERLDGPQQKIINVVIDAGRDAELSRDEIAAATGYQAGGGSFNTYLSRLSTLGLIDRDRGRIMATNVIWPEGVYR